MLTHQGSKPQESCNTATPGRCRQTQFQRSKPFMPINIIEIKAPKGITAQMPQRKSDILGFNSQKQSSTPIFPSSHLATADECSLLSITQAIRQVSQTGSPGPWFSGPPEGWRAGRQPTPPGCPLQVVSNWERQPRAGNAAQFVFCADI